MKKNIKIVSKLRKLMFTTCLFVNSVFFAQPVLNESNYDPNFFANVSRYAFTSGIGVSFPQIGENVTWDYSTLPTTPYGTYMTIPLNSDLLSAFPTGTYADSFQQNSDIGSNSVQKVYSLNSIEHKTIAVQYNNGSWNPYIYETQIFPWEYQDAAGYGGQYIGYGSLITPFSTHENVIVTRETLWVHLSVAGYNYKWYTTNPYRLVAVFRASPTVPYSIEFYNYEPNLSTIDVIKNNFEIYPNPTNSDLFVKKDNDLQYDIYFSIYDISGKGIISKEKLECSINKINLIDISSGLYFIKIYNKNNQIIKFYKFIKK